MLIWKNPRMRRPSKLAVPIFGSSTRCITYSFQLEKLCSKLFHVDKQKKKTKKDKGAFPLPLVNVYWGCMYLLNFLISPPPSRGLTDESEILKFLQHGTLVGLLPVPHPILIRKYQANSGTTLWFRTYMWGVIYLRYATVVCHWRQHVYVKGENFKL